MVGHAPAKASSWKTTTSVPFLSVYTLSCATSKKNPYKLGIPLRTRHNEVAPAQFECAPIFEEVNIAVDHNSLLMDVMSKVAKRHKLKVLLHEKPFAGINGSGKHNNWSLRYRHRCEPAGSRQNAEDQPDVPHFLREHHQSRSRLC